MRAFNVAPFKCPRSSSVDRAAFSTHKRPMPTQNVKSLNFCHGRLRKVERRNTISESNYPEGRTNILSSYSPASASPSSSYNEHKPKTPPPDLPSLLLDSRIVYIGMPLVPAVTELIVSELLYMQYTDSSRPCYIYINSTGCQRADGEVVGFETEATSIYDTMKYIGNEIYTVGTGVAIGQACMILSAGDKGKRFMTPHATAMLHQPRVPSTGQRQAIELHLKWKEVLEQKKAMINILSQTTGHSKDKVDKDIQRPFYMTASDAISYGIVDRVVDRNAQAIDSVLTNDEWDSAAGLIQSS